MLATGDESDGKRPVKKAYPSTLNSDELETVNLDDQCTCNCPFHFNINRRDLQRQNVAYNVDRVKFEGRMTKWPVQKQTVQHETRRTRRRIILFSNSSNLSKIQ